MFGSQRTGTRAAAASSAAFAASSRPVVPLAMGANVVRVILTVHLVSSRGIEYAQGLLHDSFGLATYLVGTLALVGVARILR